MRDAFIKTLLEIAKKDPNVILVTGDLGFGVLDNFAKELPNQFINSGVNEQTMMGMAAGISSTGKRVFVYSIGNFPTLRCIEQIRNDVALMDNSVVVVSVGAGYSYGSQGYTHHALEDIAMMRALPNMDVIIPCDPVETELLTTQIAKSNKPSYLRIGKSNEIIFHKTKPSHEYGKFICFKEGNAGNILAVGSVISLALLASKELESKGLNIGVYSVPYVSQIDISKLSQIAKSGPILTIEEHSYRGGFGSAILEACAANEIKADIRIVASDQKNLSQIGGQEFLRDQNGINLAKIIKNFII